MMMARVVAAISFILYSCCLLLRSIFFNDMASPAMKVGSESTNKLTVIDFDRMAF